MHYSKTVQSCLYSLLNPSKGFPLLGNPKETSLRKPHLSLDIKIHVLRA